MAGLFCPVPTPRNLSYHVTDGYQSDWLSNLSKIGQSAHLITRRQNLNLAHALRFRLWKHSTKNNGGPGVLHLVRYDWNAVHFVCYLGCQPNMCHLTHNSLGQVQTSHYSHSTEVRSEMRILTLQRSFQSCRDPLKWGLK